MIKQFLVSISFLSIISASYSSLVDPDFTSISELDPSISSFAKVTDNTITGFCNTCYIQQLKPERINELIQHRSTEAILSEILSIFVVARLVNAHETLAKILENRITVLSLWYTYWIGFFDQLHLEGNENARFRRAELLEEQNKRTELKESCTDFTLLFKHICKSSLGLMVDIKNMHTLRFKKSIFDLSGDVIPILPLEAPVVPIEVPTLPKEDPILEGNIKENLFCVEPLTQEKMQMLLQEKSIGYAVQSLCKACETILCSGVFSAKTSLDSKILQHMFWSRITMLQAVFANVLLVGKDLSEEQIQEATYYYAKIAMFRRVADENNIRYFHPLVFSGNPYKYWMTYPEYSEVKDSWRAKLNYNEQLQALFDSIWFRLTE